MPRRDDIRKICVIGAGPIVIGQACEFDYSGTQALKALRAHGYEVVLINSNPATIMTDPEMADRIYIEPLLPDIVAKILERERPDALLPTLGGQTALNLALALHERGDLERLGIELLGAGPEAIRVAEDREEFKKLMISEGLEVARSGRASSLAEARVQMAKFGIPCVVRPFFTLGGVGGSIVENLEDFDKQVSWALSWSPVGEVLIEESLLGWREFEMEVIRDHQDHGIVICSIENLDPMGIHTGDSITVAPAQTLTDREYQKMRDASLRILRAVDVATGGSNVQFAMDPHGERMIVIEMNPRVSRSSALASKATGFPIAKIAALLAVGYTLDELPNDITRTTSACFEPALDYVVTKIPRFAFEKFPGADRRLTTQMKSIGEVMAIGRTFSESLQKALRGLEVNDGTLALPTHFSGIGDAELIQRLQAPEDDRFILLVEALRRKMGIEKLHELTSIDAWFLAEIEESLVMERDFVRRHRDSKEIDRYWLREMKRIGFSDRHLGALLGQDETSIRSRREALKIFPTYKRVDTCAAEFEAFTPYLYSTYEEECEADPDDTPSILILGSGPNRIGQGIEFDYCCVKAATATKASGRQAIMLNCNPETVSTDHDTSDRLYFEPIDLESVLEVIRLEKPEGVIVQLGGQTPLRLAAALDALGVPILGTTADVLDLAEDRARFSAFAKEIGLQTPEHRTSFTPEETVAAAAEIGYPVLLRPSNVLGGQGMAILHTPAQLDTYLAGFFRDGVANDLRSLPLLVDCFLEDAIEVDVDALCDGKRTLIGGIMEQVERAGVHSGDSSCSLPPATLSEEVQEALREITRNIALKMGVVGLMNVQYAIQGSTPDGIYILEVNPRASRTVPFVSKATGVCMATAATRIMLGESLDDQGLFEDLQPRGHFCKEVVLPLSRFGSVSPQLSPEMRSTGEVMAQGESAAGAFARAQMAAYNQPKLSGPIFIDTDTKGILGLAKLAPQLSEYPLWAPTVQAKDLSETLGREVKAVDLDSMSNEVLSEIAFALLLRRAGDGLQDAGLIQNFRHIQRTGRAYFTSTEAASLWLQGAAQAEAWQAIALGD